MQAIDFAKSVTESFALPDACVRIREMLDDDYSTVDDIAEVVSLDPSLSANLLKLANSALYNFPHPVSSISKAVNVIGGEALYSLVMTETASTVYREFDDASINLERFWEQSVYTSLIARQLAYLSCRKDADRLFLIGLLMSFGELAVAREEPIIAQACEKYSVQVSPWQTQQRKLGFYYTDVTYDILRLWGLPDQVYQPIRFCHNVSYGLESLQMALLNASYRCALTIVHPDMYAVKDLLNLEMMKIHNISEEMIMEAIDYARTEAYSILVLMNPDMFLVV